MQATEMTPIEFFGIVLLGTLVMIFLTYYGFNIMSRGHKVSSFSRPKWSTMIGIWTFIFFGMLLGILAVFGIYYTQMGIEGFEWLFNNVYGYVAAVSLIVCFTVPLGYLYIYRGGA